MNIEEISGWIGAVLVLIAYYMVTSGKAKADSSGFQLMNIVGAGFLVYYTYSLKAYASMSVNIIWVIIGISSFKNFLKLKGFNLENIVNVLREGVVMKLKTKVLFTIVSAVLVISVSGKSFAQEIGNEDYDLVTDSSSSSSSEDEMSADSDIEESDEETSSTKSDEDGSEDAEVSVDESE
jgi:hypothetical protein